jgi:hypothetical protein
MKKYYRIQIAQFQLKLQSVILYSIQLECDRIDFQLLFISREGAR